METSDSLVASAPYEDRRGLLITFGIFDIFVGCGFLLLLGLVAFALFGPFAAKMAAAGASKRPFPNGLIAATVFIQYGLAAALFFTGGIGSIRCKNWARILMLVVSGLWLALGLMVTAIMALILPSQMAARPAPVDPSILHGVMAGLFIFIGILTIILPSIFLFFYSRPSVKATCLARNKPELATGRAAGTTTMSLPVPLGILGGWEALTSLSIVAALFMRVTVMFGVVLHGASAVLVLLAYSLLSAFAGAFIFQRNLTGWYLALGKTGIWTASLIVNCFRPVDMANVLRGQGYDEKTLTVFVQMPHFMTETMAITAVFMAALLGFIVYARKYFPKDEQTL